MALAMLLVGNGCVDHRCPSGYAHKEGDGDTCYRIKKDAGSDGAVALEGDGGLEDATLPSFADAQSAPGDDGSDSEEGRCAACGAHSRCVAATGNVTCACEPGYLQEGEECVADVSCAALECDENAACLQDGAARRCECVPGYKGSGQDCTDIDECTMGNGGCPTDAICYNEQGGRSCECKPGFVDVHGDGSECKSTIVNECASTNVCTADYPCQDLEMLYTCRGQFAEAPPMDSPNYLRAEGAFVTDTRTGLVWESSEGALCTWEEAKARCSRPGGWRLPTRAELQSIVDFPKCRTGGGCIDKALFPKTSGHYFWTSSPDPEDPAKAWSFMFGVGLPMSIAKSTQAFYRCVR